ncbi:MAG: phospholipid methyltransferase [Mesorhizobium sp.]|jgi:phosphatidylethanolamine/phosphatidyl-N-methylethanolamine N-methyltransferase
MSDAYLSFGDADIVDGRPIWLRSETLRAALLAELATTRGPIIELGAGAGNLAQALANHGIAEPDLVLIEADRNMARLLRRRFPEASVFNRDATCLAVLDFYMKPDAGAIVSSLPFASMPLAKTLTILNAAFLCARPTAPFYQLSATLSSPIPDAALTRLDLTAERIHPVSTRRLQPSLFKIQRRDASALSASPVLP